MALIPRCTAARIVLTFLTAALALIAPAGVAPSLAQERVQPKSPAEMQFSFAALVKRAAPAVVNIYVDRLIPADKAPFFNDPFFRQFFGEESGGPTKRVPGGLGSGVIVSAEGLVVTNYHVIQIGGETNIKVGLADSREFAARVILLDARTDLAVLRIESQQGGFSYLTFADSDAVEVGDLVLAIGNPFGFGHTVTSGIVSMARTFVSIAGLQFYIQTDAAINPGNSGGPLIDMNGQIVGINTLSIRKDPEGGGHGVGFAVPANMVRLIVEAAQQGRAVTRPWLGAELKPLTSELAQKAGLDRPAGALVGRVRTGSPAERAGLRTGDVIVGIDGRGVNDPAAFTYRFTIKGIGGSSVVAVMREARRQELTIALAAPPEDPPREVQKLSGNHPFSGASLANLSPAVAEELNIEEISGVVILQIEPDSRARRAGLQPGDIIREINGKDMQSVPQLVKLFESRPNPLRVTIKRRDRDVRTVFGG